MPVASAKVVNPNRSVNNNHDYILADLRLGMVFNPFSVPPSLASLLLLSREIKASRPRRTKVVFSEIPVSREAFSNILSSMFNVVLICMMMHHLCIYVSGKPDLMHPCPFDCMFAFKDLFDFSCCIHNRIDLQTFQTKIIPKKHSVNSPQLFYVLFNGLILNWLNDLG